MRRLILVAAVAVTVALPSTPVGFGGGFVTSLRAESAEVLAKKAQSVLARFCLRCHANAETDYFDVRSRSTLLARAPHNDLPYITAGDLEKSLLWEYIRDKSSAMPKSGEERATFTDAERQVLRQWILAGAPEWPKEPERTPIALEVMLQRIWEHASSVSPRELPHLRYFTLVHLHNQSPQRVTSADLRMVSAALSKVLNSLSWSPNRVLPEEVPGTQGTVLVVNLSRLGWNREAWKAVADAYPYGLGYDNHDDERLRDIDTRLRKLYDNREQLIYVRADWFVATASRPPLYHAILYDSVLPALRMRPVDASRPANPKRMTVHDLESHLGVDVIANLWSKNPSAMRAGFPTSGVSTNNRLVERHPLRGQGAYWKSYDFRSSTWEANLTQFPLGPLYPQHPFPQLAFRHDGGEIIFHLPNGLQGYLLVDGMGERIDAGPIEIVNDAAQSSGSPVIVNGLSCMACHKHGLRPIPSDQVRRAGSVYGEARERVMALYREKAVIDEALARDQALFLDALEHVIGPFLRQEDQWKTVPVTELPEPVSEVVRRYLASKDDLDAETIACELYLPDVRMIREKAASSDVFRQLGLGVLVSDHGRVKREAWQATRGTSLMQQAAREFGYSPR